jgi:hypothetical protein
MERFAVIPRLLVLAWMLARFNAYARLALQAECATTRLSQATPMIVQ